MAAISTYLANKLLDHTLRGIPYTAPTTVYVALYTSDPGPENTGTEVSGGGYTRVKAVFKASSGGQITLDRDVEFPVATATWGTVTHIGIMDSPTGGNLLYFMPLSNPKFIDTGDQLKIPAGQLTINMA